MHGAPQAVVFLLLSPEDQYLCVVQLLKEYEKWTEAFWPRSRKADKPPFSSPIFAHIDQWHLSACIAHWVKDHLSEMGADTSRSEVQ